MVHDDRWQWTRDELADHGTLDEYAPATKEVRVLPDGTIVADGLALLEHVNSEPATHFDRTEVNPERTRAAGQHDVPTGPYSNGRRLLGVQW
jgi:hypothetical protein